MTIRPTFGRTSTAAGAALLCLALAACSSGKKDPASNLPVPDASAPLFDARGADRGRVDIFRDSDGLRLELVARGF
ncbi:MAG TPA: superoxide dismutase family protein, partial [Sphingopyxis sp.]|nr:superoxide dismutase family protein [Sphingopyxis sp.]